MKLSEIFEDYRSNQQVYPLYILLLSILWQVLVLWVLS